jgi:coenzyme Q-binding protein COQ10
MAKVEKSITINAPMEEVFAYVEDPMNQLEYLPSIVEVKDVTGQGVGAHYHWTYKMTGLRFEGESTMTEYIPNERMVVETKGGIVSTWSWTFTPEDGGTRVDLTVEYTIPVPVLGRLGEALVLRQNEREADQALANIKAKLER